MTTPLTVSARGLVALALHEGIVPAPYRDSVGVWTWGIGHTAAAGAPDPARMPRGMPSDLDAAVRACVAQFMADIERYARDVRRAVKVPLEQHQFDALVSFHYNTGGIARAGITRRLNAGDLAGAAVAFSAWSKPPEIIPRRQAERELFVLGTYPAGKVPVWSVNRQGRVIFRAVRQLSADELLTMIDDAQKKTGGQP